MTMPRRTFSRRGFSRRGFLRLAAWLGVAGAGSAAIRPATPFGLGRGAALDPGVRLVAAIAHPEGAARVGRTALAAGLVEQDTHALLAALADTVPGLDKVLGDGSDNEIRHALDAARRRDFAEHGDGIVLVRGWVVARTEARVCALVALHQRA